MLLKTHAGKIIVVAVIFLAFAVVLFSTKTNKVPGSEPKLASSINSENKTKLNIKDTVITVDIADNDQKRSRGLSGREPLKENEGMLFIWNSEVSPGFWMKDMKFDLDLIWLNNGKVVYITENAKAEPGVPDNKLTIYTSKYPIDMVLEVIAGFSRKNGIAVGDDIEINLPEG